MFLRSFYIFFLCEVTCVLRKEPLHAQVLVVTLTLTMDRSEDDDRHLTLGHCYDSRPGCSRRECTVI